MAKTRCTCVLIACVVFISSIHVVRGAVRVDVKPDWKEQAGRCVLAPLVCDEAVNCFKVEGGFLKRAQEILVVESPEAVKSVFFENSVEQPTTEEILALAKELGFDSVLFGESLAADSWTTESVHTPHSSTHGPHTGPAHGSTTHFSGSTRLVLKKVDGTLLVDGTAVTEGATFSFSLAAPDVRVPYRI